LKINTIVSEYRTNMGNLVSPIFVSIIATLDKLLLSYYLGNWLPNKIEYIRINCIKIDHFSTETKSLAINSASQHLTSREVNIL